ncbi:MAG: hypothetical protein Q9181_008256, partial [Wetmoreana brouardii]
MPCWHQVYEVYEQQALKSDYLGRSTVKCTLPITHITKLVGRQFAGLSWMRINEDDLKRDFQALGAEFKSAKLGGKVRRNMVVFPSIEGVIHLLIKKGWMTKEEAAIDD